MTDMNYWYWLSRIPHLGPKKYRQLLDYFHNPENIYFSKESHLKDCKCLSLKDVESILLYRKNSDKLIVMYEQMEEQGIHFVGLGDKAYPEHLKTCFLPPIGLYYKGKLPDENKRRVAIVGARMCTPYGKAMAKEISKELAKCGVEIVSGLARGIDGYAHEGCMEAGENTYAILAGGVDEIYPPEHYELYTKILQQGGILSEYPPGMKPQKGMFPMRNRIISGLCEAVILVEAREKSGSLITADYALEQGKEIYVVPGRISDALSVGCNQYIRQGAQIITSIPDLISQMNLSQTRKDTNWENEKILLEKEEALVYSCLRLTPRGLDEIAAESGVGLLRIIEIIGRLIELELAEEYCRNLYIRRT